MKNHNYCPEFYVTEISMISQPKEIFPHGGRGTSRPPGTCQTGHHLVMTFAFSAVQEQRFTEDSVLCVTVPRVKGGASASSVTRDCTPAGWQALRQKCLDFLSLKAQTLPVTRIYTLDNYLQKVHLSW